MTIFYYHSLGNYNHDCTIASYKKYIKYILVDKTKAL